jgi:hypothetical protein
VFIQKLPLILLSTKMVFAQGVLLKQEIKNIDWDKTLEELKSLVESYRSKNGDNYDCIIPVSGGKDSYFQTYFVKGNFKTKSTFGNLQRP